MLAGPFGLRGGRDHFYRNNGDGTFRDATDEAGMTDTAESYGLGVLASDLDNDGDVDVFVANDSNPNFLYRNDGDGTFTEIGAWSGAGLNGEGVGPGRHGGRRGRLRRRRPAGHLRHQLRPGLRPRSTTTWATSLFHDVSAGRRLKAVTYEALKWGCAFFDFDHDADLDLVIANGHIYPQVDSAPELNESYRQRPILLRNDERPADRRLARRPGPGMQVGRLGPRPGRGRLRRRRRPRPARHGDRLARRSSSATTRRGAGHWLKLRLLNRHGSPAIGARVVRDGRRRDRRRGNSAAARRYQSQNALELHFGLGTATKVDLLEVPWPGGRKTSLRDVAADRTITLRERPDIGRE